MAKSKVPHTVRDDELDVAALFERDHAPKGKRPCESLHVTVPMMAAVQKAQEAASQPLSLNTKDAWAWLCEKAGVACDPSWLDKRPLALRAKEEAKADATVELDGKVLENVRALLSKGKTPDQVSFLMKAGHFSDAHVAAYLKAATPSDNPFI